MWGCTKYINGITFIPYVRTKGEILPTDTIHEIYVSDSRGLDEEIVQNELADAKSNWIGRQYKDWC